MGALNRARWVALGLLALAGCAGQGNVVYLDLCPGREATEDDRATIRQANQWEITVSGLDGDEVVWSDDWAGAGAADSLSLESSIPEGGNLRIHVEGWSSGSGGSRLVAVATSGVLSLSPGLRICLCTAPPERYDDLCGNPACNFDAASGQCWP